VPEQGSAPDRALPRWRAHPARAGGTVRHHRLHHPPGIDRAKRRELAAALVLRTGHGTGLLGELLTTARTIEAHHHAVGDRTEATRIHTAVTTPLTALGLTAGIHQALARAAERATEPEPDYRAWEHNIERGREGALER